MNKIGKKEIKKERKEERKREERRKLMFFSNFMLWPKDTLSSSWVFQGAGVQCR